MFLLYDLIFFIFAIVYLPFFLLKKKFHQGFIQRLGFLPAGLQLENNIWIHAVSVGEARLAQILAKQLRQIYPEKKFIFSTVTTTGNSIVRSFKKDEDFVFYLPLDLSFITKNVIHKLKPCICIIIETEIWPNLITQLNKMNIPVVLVNARISDGSFLGYRIARSLIKPILNRINLFCVRSKEDLERLSDLGVPSDKLEVTGNMKYDIVNSLEDNLDDRDFRFKLGLRPEEKIFLAGSTHQGEEKIILNIYRKLINEFPLLRLLIAPRHPDRIHEIEMLIHKFGFLVSRISRINKQADTYANSKNIFLLDTIGQLLSFYAIADIVFVGGSLIKKGGHNILEPAFFKKPIIFGPYMFNFHDISDLFLNKKAACMVHNRDELLKELRFLLRNHSELLSMGKRARQLVLENQGAVGKNVQKVSLFISHR